MNGSPNGLDVGWSSVAPAAAELLSGARRFAQYYEMRLAGEEPRLDYLASVERAAASYVSERLAARIESTGLHAARWRTIARLIDDWANGGSLISHMVPALWLEFDEFDQRAVDAAPSVCACITPSYGVDVAHLPHREADLELCNELVDVLGVPRGHEVNDLLAMAFSCLPSNARWIHLSYMLAREPAAVKLYGVMDRNDLARYLAAIGWAGEENMIVHALADLYPQHLLGNELYLDLNLENVHDPKTCSLGLAVGQQHVQRGPVSDPAHRQLLQSWAQTGLCASEKVDAILAWPSEWRATDGASCFKETRFLDLKLVWSAGSGFHAKAYAGLQRVRAVF